MRHVFFSSTKVTPTYVPRKVFGNERHLVQKYLLFANGNSHRQLGLYKYSYLPSPGYKNISVLKNFTKKLSANRKFIILVSFCGEVKVEIFII